MNKPYFRSHPEGAAPRLHVWRADPYRQARAPLSGFYSVGKHTAFVYQGAPYPDVIRNRPVRTSWRTL